MGDREKHRRNFRSFNSTNQIHNKHTVWHSRTHLLLSIVFRYFQRSIISSTILFSRAIKKISRLLWWLYKNSTRYIEYLSKVNLECAPKQNEKHKLIDYHSFLLRIKRTTLLLKTLLVHTSLHLLQRDCN